MMTTTPANPGDDPGDDPDARTTPNRVVRPAEWVVLGLVIGLVLGLGGALMMRSAGEEADSVSGPATVTVTATAPVSGSGSGGTASYPARTTIPGTADHADTTADRTLDDVVTSVIQPPAVTGAEPSDEQAGAIGPMGDQARRIDGDPLARGDVDAPVVMVMFEDYRCPFCAKFSTDLEPQIIDEYVDSGTLRLEWRDFPIFGDESVRAAVAGRAAAEQGMFWEFNRTIFAAAPQSGHPDYDDDDLIDFARDAGVPDIEQFRADLDSDELRAAVEEDFRAGQQLGVPATPSFVINGYPMRGAQPIDRFFQVIDQVAERQ